MAAGQTSAPGVGWINITTFCREGHPLFSQYIDPGSDRTREIDGTGTFSSVAVKDVGSKFALGNDVSQFFSEIQAKAQAIDVGLTGAQAIGRKGDGPRPTTR